MYKFSLTFLLCCWFCNTSGQTDSVVQRLILVGDAGELRDGRQPELELLNRLYPLNDSNTAIVYLGDNIYPIGLPDAPSAAYERRRKILDVQIDFLRDKKARGIVIPGNHDWMQGHPRGVDQLKNQETYVTNKQMPNLVFSPLNGCPGPVEIPLSESMVMVVVDSQWWLQQKNRPEEDADCECKTEDEVVLQLKDILYRNRNKLVVYAAHHPFITYGKHGGYFNWKQHFFPLTEVSEKLYVPLPVLGSFYAISRGVFGNIQDTKHPEYKNYIERIDAVLSTHPYCIRVAGHEHALQYIEKLGQHYIVSGAASKRTQVRAGKGSVFVDEGTGFGVIELLRSGEVILKFFSSQSPTAGKPIYAGNLRTYLAPGDTHEAAMVREFPDSMTLAAASYYKAGGFKKWLFGSNYRSEWTTPVTIRSFDIMKEKGGLTPIKRGGGFQSKSLRLEDKDGKQYVLRSIEKFPARTLPEEFRQTFVKDAVVDGISASYPYAALSVPDFAAAAGIPHAKPEIVYLPDDPALKQYRSDFGNGMYLFEEREPGDVIKTDNTLEVIEDLQKDNDHKVDQFAVLNARLLDMFIMDFDRHEDQWRWGNAGDKKNRNFFPIPRDRDQPFFVNQGVIPKAISWSWILPKFQGFRAKARNINTFNFNARYFDRSFLNTLNEKDWNSAIDSFLPKMSDEVIQRAIGRQPVEIKDFHGSFITNTLKERRKFFRAEMLKYYHFLEQEVDVVGSDKRELFHVLRNNDGSVQVTVTKINKEGRLSDVLFDRVFLHRFTDEIRLWALGGSDSIRIEGGVNKSIRVRAIGGAGPDHFIVDGSARKRLTLLYDYRGEDNQIVGDRFKNKLSLVPEVNRYDRKAYKYNILQPFISAAFNPDDGVFLGVSVKNTRHGFRKDPHKIVHFFRANKALATGAYNFTYRIDAVDVLGRTDIVAEVDAKAPDNVQNFFGLGNETVFENKAPKKISYYRSRYNLVQGLVLLRNNPAPFLSLLTGPVFQHYWIEREHNKDRFISTPGVPGIDSATLYKPKSFLGWQFEANIDNRDNDVMPTRGALWKNSARVVKGINNHANDFAQLSTDLSLYVSFSVPADVVIAARVGGGINYGKYEFFQAQYLSGIENLRGYRRFRFGGDKMFYNNLDLRIRLADFRGYILPGSIGLVGFHDVGRVWMREENSGRWHTGYGGGVWLAPAKRYVIAACYGFSKDGGLPFVTLGFQF
ncbi:MAG: hypothetical protein EOO04_05945 [Chitinophagaceae bacterium]|nr:MAG: hypothetical protein EOO04_05945 [Chitinophagaceae bacterium]